MRFHYLFKEKIKNEEHYFKLIVVKQTSKYKYILELHKKRIDELKTIDSLKLGCFLYSKNNKYCIYDSKNYIFREFNEPANFIVDDKKHCLLQDALIDLFNTRNIE